MEVIAAGISGDLAYTVSYEHSSLHINGRPQAYTLRVTHIYRYDNGEWKFVHRHGDRLRKMSNPGSISPEDRRDQGEIMPISLFAVVVDCRDHSS